MGIWLAAFLVVVAVATADAAEASPDLPAVNYTVSGQYLHCCHFPVHLL
jgi:hypothetical protein